MSRNHLTLLTQRPSVAQSGLEIKLTGTTDIIDRLLLAQRQAPWKLVESTGTTGTGTDPGTDTGGGGTGGIGL